MSAVSPNSPVYRTSVEQKRKARESARRGYGTPKLLRQMLREKCRIRAHEARQCLFGESRNDNNKFKKLTFDEILRQELAELENDVNLQEQIYNELKDEANQWFAEELEQEESHFIQSCLVTFDDVLMCPVCQKCTLDYNDNTKVFTCACSIK